MEEEEEEEEGKKMKKNTDKSGWGRKERINRWFF